MANDNIGNNVYNCILYWVFFSACVCTCTCAYGYRTVCDNYIQK